MGDDMIICLYLMSTFFFLWLQYMFDMCLIDAFVVTLLLMCIIYHGYLGFINLIDSRISNYLKQRV